MKGEEVEAAIYSTRVVYSLVAKQHVSTRVKVGPFFFYLNLSLTHARTYKRTAI